MKQSHTTLLPLMWASLLACSSPEGPDSADTESGATDGGSTGTASGSASGSASTSSSTTSDNTSSDASSTGEPSTGGGATETSSSSGDASSSSTGAAALYEILDPEVEHFEMSYPEWAAAWWQWVMGLPATNHPLLDDTGMNCTEGQSGPVFFLAGTFGGRATRTCTAPADAAVFLPIANVTADNAGFPEEEWLTEAELQAAAVGFIDGLDDFTLEIDGDTYDMTALSDYRVELYQSTYTVPDEDSLLDFFGLPVDVVGVVDPTYGDGIYVMVQFEPGEHDIHFHAEDADIGFTTDVTYVLTVE